MLMDINRLPAVVKMNIGVVVLIVLALLIIIIGGFGVYLAEHGRQGVNINKISDALWWAAVTITTVGYGDYYPVTALGRIIAVIMMFSGIGIVVLLVSSLSQRRFERAKSRLKSYKESGPTLLDDDTKIAIKSKIAEIEKLTEEVNRLLAVD